MIVSGSGPSSRMLPARTYSTPWRMHSYITPDVSTPCSTACFQAAGLADRVDRPHVVPMPAFDGLAGLEVDAERGAEQRLLDVVNGQGVAGEQDVDVSGTNSS